MSNTSLHLTKKELAFRWQCSTRTVERAVRTFGLHPIDFIGHQPVFELSAVERMEVRRKEARAKLLGYQLTPELPLPDKGILTVKEAKRRAWKGGAR